MVWTHQPYDNEQTHKVTMEVRIVTTNPNTDVVKAVALNQLKNAFGGNVSIGRVEVSPQ